MTAWIFLRGLTRERRHWGDFPAVFRRELPDAEVLVPDQPGNGTLNALRSPAGIGAMAEHCRATLQAQGVRPPYCLLAMSLGAMVAAEWATRHPEDLSGAVLISTSFGGISPFHRRLRPRNYATLLGLALPGMNDAAREAAVLRLTSRLAEDRDRIVRDWSAWRREHPVARANALRQLWAAACYRPPAQRPAVPMLVLAGAKDGLVDPACSRELARLWQTGYAEHPAAGHDLPLDDGAWVARETASWLRRLEERGAAP